MQTACVKEKPAVASGGQGDEDAGTGKIVYSYDITSPAFCQPPFDYNLSRQIDQAVSEADTHDLAARDHWRATQYHAFQAIKAADLRDRALARIVYLESRMPDLEGNDDRNLD